MPQLHVPVGYTTNDGAHWGHAVVGGDRSARDTTEVVRAKDRAFCLHHRVRTRGAERLGHVDAGRYDTNVFIKSITAGTNRGSEASLYDAGQETHVRAVVAFVDVSHQPAGWISLLASPRRRLVEARWHPPRVLGRDHNAGRHMMEGDFEVLLEREAFTGPHEVASVRRAGIAKDGASLLGSNVRDSFSRELAHSWCL